MDNNLRGQCQLFGVPHSAIAVWSMVPMESRHRDLESADPRDGNDIGPTRDTCHQTTHGDSETLGAVLWLQCRWCLDMG